MAENFFAITDTTAIINIWRSLPRDEYKNRRHKITYDGGLKRY